MACSGTANGGRARRERIPPARRQQHATHDTRREPTTHPANILGSHTQASANDSLPNARSPNAAIVA
eukprot:14972321-Alexandrium_andersonii.AAC.1